MVNTLFTRVRLMIERDEDGIYVVECPILSGCYSQGKTLDEALRNIQEVIALVCEEEANRTILRDYLPREISFHTAFACIRQFTKTAFCTRSC